MHNTLLTPYQIKTFWEQGFLFIPSFYPDKVIDKLHLSGISHFTENPAFKHNQEFIKKSSTDVIPWFPQQTGNALFDDVQNHQSIIAITESLMGLDWSTQDAMVMYSKPGSNGQAWHQDCPPENPNHFNLNRLVYTSDITEQTGGFIVVRPRTHRVCPISSGDLHEDFVDQVVLKPTKGSLILLHGHTWHRVTHTLNSPRLSINFRCIPRCVPSNITDICVYRNMRYQFSTQTVLTQQ
jgi:ectoine hydroxylase